MHFTVRRFIVLLGFLTLGGCGGGGGGSSPAPDPTPPPAGTPEIDVQQVFASLSFSQPVSMLQAPGDTSRWFVLEQAGVVRVFANDVNAANASVFLDISSLVASGGETGLLGIAFHPSFPAGTPDAYLSYTARPGGQLTSQIARFSTVDNGATLDAGTEEILLTISQPFSNHNGGALAFGHDGLLYASFGDGGGGGDPLDNAQNTSNLLGTIVRIDIDGNSPYEIPPGNPFFGNGFCFQGVGSAACPEIYAYGLRNPWRMSFDSATGDLWLGDVGQGAWEEVNRVEAGQNYGWDCREGAHDFEPANCTGGGLAEPVSEYPNPGLGGSVTGGYVYRGTAIPDLVGWYVFGDFISGRIFAVPADSQPTTAPEVLLDTTLSISTFAEDSDGELYVIDYGSGTILKIVAAP